MEWPFNYRHLYYFWVVAQEGGMSRAAARLDMAVQTISAQVRLLEQDLGCQLLEPAGRGVALTEAGRVACAQAEQIFQLGQALPDRLRSAVDTRTVRLRVGIADGLPKLEVQRLLQPILGTEGLRLVCHEGEMADLLADLVVHQLDVVLADHPAPFDPHLKVHSHQVGASGVAWFGVGEAARQAAAAFPAVLQDLPLLLPTRHSTVRARLDQWLSQQGLSPRVVGEFEDSALLETFGGEGFGCFPAALAVEDTLVHRHGACRIGICEGVEERVYAISAERRVVHPLVQQLLAGVDPLRTAQVP